MENYSDAISMHIRWTCGGVMLHRFCINIKLSSSFLYIFVYGSIHQLCYFAWPSIHLHTSLTQKKINVELRWVTSLLRPKFCGLSVSCRITTVWSNFRCNICSVNHDIRFWMHHSYVHSWPNWRQLRCSSEPSRPDNSHEALSGPSIHPLNGPLFQ